MFKFDFDIDDADDGLAQIPVTPGQDLQEQNSAELKAFTEIPISELVCQRTSFLLVSNFWDKHSSIDFPISSRTRPSLSRCHQDHRLPFLDEIFLMLVFS